MINISVKSEKICLQCNQTHKYPPCGVLELNKNNELVNILNCDYKASKTQNLIVCPVNAIKPMKFGININQESCIACGICSGNCSYGNIELIDEVKEEKAYPLFSSSLLHVASFLKSKLNNEYVISTEVKSEGNARNKRIDIVVDNTKTTYLLKILSGKPTTSKYERDYEKILKNISEVSHSKKIELIYLYIDCSSLKNLDEIEISNKTYKVNKVSIENLISIFIN